EGAAVEHQLVAGRRGRVAAVEIDGFGEQPPGKVNQERVAAVAQGDVDQRTGDGGEGDEYALPIAAPEARAHIVEQESARTGEDLEFLQARAEAAQDADGHGVIGHDSGSAADHQIATAVQTDADRGNVDRRLPGDGAIRAIGELDGLRAGGS